MTFSLARLRTPLLCLCRLVRPQVERIKGHQTFDGNGQPSQGCFSLPWRPDPTAGPLQFQDLWEIHGKPLLSYLDVPHPTLFVLLQLILPWKNEAALNSLSADAVLFPRIEAPYSSGSLDLTKQLALRDRCRR